MRICAVSPVPGGVGPVTLACLLEADGANHRAFTADAQAFRGHALGDAGDDQLMRAGGQVERRLAGDAGAPGIDGDIGHARRGLDAVGKRGGRQKLAGAQKRVHRPLAIG